MRYAVWISYLEIYNEKIYDLLDETLPTKREPLKLKEDQGKQVFVKDLKEIHISSAQVGHIDPLVTICRKVMKFFAKGNETDKLQVLC